MSSLTEIAQGILANAKQLDAFCSTQNLPPSSFHRDTFADLPPDLELTRKALINSTQELKRIALGPTGLFVELLYSVSQWLWSIAML